jgi:multiple antibiotic resistance protein
MIFPTETGSSKEKLSSKDPLVVPLAIPLIAGPAVLAAVMLYAGRSQISRGTGMGAIVLAWTASTLILLSSSVFQRWLGERGLIAIERLMGLILTLLSIEMFLKGLSTFLQQS